MVTTPEYGMITKSYNKLSPTTYLLDQVLRTSPSRPSMFSMPLRLERIWILHHLSTLLLYIDRDVIRLAYLYRL